MNLADFKKYLDKFPDHAEVCILASRQGLRGDTQVTYVPFKGDDGDCFLYEDERRGRALLELGGIE